MLDLIKSNRVLIKQFITYGVIGAIAAGSDSLVFFLLTSYTNISIYVTNVFTILLGITISFILNAYINFKVKDKIFIRALKFYCVGGLGLLLSQLILFVGVEALGIGSMYVKLFSIFLVAVFQFVLNKLITFRSSANE